MTGKFLFLLTAFASLWLSCAGAAESRVLLIDAVELRGKAYLAGIGEEVVVRDLFGSAKVNWLIPNSSGQAVCSASFRTQTVVLKLDTLASRTGPVIIEPSKVPTIVEGDLSPDGTKLCFRLIEHGKGVLRVFDLAGGDTETIVAADGPVSPPAWSLDGNAVAYYLGTRASPMDDSFSVVVSEKVDERWQHVVVGPPSKLCHRDLKTREFGPMWGPLGENVVFEARYQESEVGPQSYIAARGGGRLTRIGDIYSTPGSFPGHTVVTYAVRGKGVFSYDCRHRKVAALLPQKNVYFPRLSPDKELVAYSDSDGILCVARIDGSEPRKIMDMGTKVAFGKFRWLCERRGKP